MGSSVGCGVSGCVVGKGGFPYRVVQPIVCSMTGWGAVILLDEAASLTRSVVGGGPCFARSERLRV